MAKGFWAYGRIVLCEAWNDAKDFGAANIIFPAGSAVLCAIGTFAALRISHTAAEFARMSIIDFVLIPLEGAIIGIVLSILVAFAVYLLRAPHKIYWKSISKIDVLEARLKPGFKLTLVSRNVPDGHKILAGWYLRIEAINVSDIFQVFLDIASAGGGFRLAPQHLINASWDDDSLPPKQIMTGTHAEALIVYRQIFEQGFTPKIRGISNLERFEVSGDSYSWDDAASSVYSIRVIVNAANAVLSQTFTINFSGRDISFISGDAPAIEISADVLSNF